MIWLIGAIAAAVIAYESTLVALQATPEIVEFRIEPAIRDLGTIDQSVQRVSFDLCNHTDEMLTIVSIVQTCRCAQATVKDKSIPPGGRTVLSARWYSTGLRGDVATKLRINYRLGKSSVPKVAIATIRGQVISLFNYAPNSLVFFDEGEQQQQVRISPIDSSRNSVAISDFTVSHPAFNVLQIDSRAVQVEFDPAKWLNGSLPQGDLTLYTDCPREPRVMIPIRVKSR